MCLLVGRSFSLLCDYCDNIGGILREQLFGPVTFGDLRLCLAVTLVTF